MEIKNILISNAIQQTEIGEVEFSTHEEIGFGLAIAQLEYEISELTKVINDDEKEKSFTSDLHLNKSELQLIANYINSAKIHNLKGDIDIAWAMLLRATEIVFYRKGFATSKQSTSDQKPPKHHYSEYGKKGAAKKKKERAEELNKLALRILDQHKKNPFLIQRQLLDAAIQLAPGGGKKESDIKWAKNLIRETKLSDLNAKLSRRRKP